MGFKKGNKIAAAQKGKPKAKTQQWNNIVGWLVGSGGQKYLELIKKQALGKVLNKEQKEFMDRFEGLLEYHAPKLARIENDGKIDHDVTFKWQ